MALFASKPKEFAQYTPSIDQQQYSQELAQKKTEYDQGVQKVQNNISQVAMLPVAKEDDRKYLQGVVEQLTTDVNSRRGADWSDQHLQNTIAQKSQTLSADPKIRQAVSSALFWKGEFSNQELDEKRSKGANTLNKRALMDQYNGWSNSGRVGDTPNSEGYFNYVDTNGLIAKTFKDKHPNTIVSVQTAGHHTDPKTGKDIFTPSLVAKEWDETQHIWKGILPVDIENEIKDMVKVDPNLQKQLNINAHYSENLDPERILNNQKQLYERNIEQYNEALGTMSIDDPNYDTYLKNRDLLKDQIDNKIKPGLKKYANDPYAVEEDRRDLYMTDWMNSQISKYAYGEEELKHEGASPTDKQHWDADFGLKKQELILKERADARSEQKLKDAEAIARDKQRKNAEAFTTQEGITTDKTTPIDNFTKSMDQARTTVIGKKNLYLYNTYHNTNPDWFNEEGIPTKEGQKGLEDQYRKREEAFNNGNSKDNEGNWVDLRDGDYNFFKEIHGLDKVSMAMQNKLKEVDAAWSKHLLQSFDFNKNPITVEIGGQPYKLTNADIKAYADAKEEENRDPRLRHIASPIEYSQELAPIIKQGDLDKSKFYNNYLTANDYVVNPQSTLWVDQNLKDPKVNETIVQKATKLVENSGKDASILKKHKDGEGIEISYVQEPLSGNYKLKVAETGDEKNPKYFDIAPQDAPSEWNNYQNESTLAQLLRVNRDKNSNISTSYGYDEKGKPKPHKFSTAEPLVTKEYNGKTVSIKYGAKKEGNQLSVEFWVKDINDPNDKGKLMRDPKTNRVIEGTTTSQKELDLMIDNFAKSGSVTPSGYSQYIKEDEEESQE